jgi:hypothetical protein
LLRDLSFHINAKCHEADRVLGGVEEIEHQWAYRVLERLNNVGGKQRVV